MTAPVKRTARSVDRETGGFTLVELVVVVGVLGVVMAGITSILLVSMKSTEQAKEQLNESGGLRIASVYFNPDVHSADVIANSGAAGCVEAPGNANNLVVQLTGTDAIANDPQTLRTSTVSYVLTDSGSSLTRYECFDGAPPADVTVVSEGLAPGNPPSVACRKRNGTAVVCSDTTATSITVTTTSAASGTQHSMTAARRTA